MRIISGTAKGRRLQTPPAHSREIRPTTDRARESLFNIIGAKIVGSRVLDLCAGTGAFGCEALSRGAAFVVFVDLSALSLKLVADNIRLVPDGPSRSRVVRHDLYNGIEHPALSKPGTGPFDIVFADPPYQTPLAGTILAGLDRCTVLSANPLLILEEQKRFAAPEHLERLHKIDARTYGDSTFTFYRLRRASVPETDTRIDS